MRKKKEIAREKFEAKQADIELDELEVQQQLEAAGSSPDRSRTVRRGDESPSSQDLTSFNIGRLHESVAPGIPGDRTPVSPGDRMASVIAPPVALSPNSG